MFYRKSKTIYQAHSPSLYKFTKHIIEGQNKNPWYSKIEKAREAYKKNHTSINFKEFGAGSKSQKKNIRKISSIAKSSLSRKTQCNQLYRIVKEYNCKNILELGTSLGIATMHMSNGHSESQVTTLEGEPTIVHLAKSTFKANGFDSITVVEGEFENTLDSTLNTIGTIDLAFIDGNHKYGPTVSYFKQVIKNCHKESIIILDDIHWSHDMEKAWSNIITDERVTLSIDLFHMGVLFFNPTIKSKENHSLIKWQYKPWRIGLFG